MSSTAVIIPTKVNGEDVKDSTQKAPFLLPLVILELVEEVLFGQFWNLCPLSPQMKHPELVVVVDPSIP